MMKPYSEYKDSQVEWIGKIPKHWISIKLKYIGLLYGGLSGKRGNDFNEDDHPRNKPYITFTNICDNIYISKENLGKVKINENDVQNKVNKFDIFFLMSSEDQESIGKTSVLRDDIGEVYLNTFCRGFRITNKNCNALFINFLLNGHIYRELLRTEGRGFTRINLRSHKVKDFNIYCPTFLEQEKIASFLEHKTELIDRLIEKTEKKIELLKEKRTALINHCVTKGLDPNAEMKDSGVEWIGEIPKHWHLSKIKNEFLFTGGGTPSKENEEYWNGNIIWVSPKDMKSIEISDSKEKITKTGLINSTTNLINNKSLLIVIRSGILQRTIPIAINIVPVTINQDVKSLRPKKDYLLKFLYYFIKGNEVNLLKDWSKEGTTVESIEMEFMLNSLIPKTSKNEQLRIIEYLDEQTQKIDTTIEKERKRIELLKEYRQSLISNVVTGKIDVRDWNGRNINSKM